ncbi:hypothetical protein HDU67_003850, partial [Dinochytrium kinnereticum]
MSRVATLTKKNVATFAEEFVKLNPPVNGVDIDVAWQLTVADVTTITSLLATLPVSHLSINLYSTNLLVEFFKAPPMNLNYLKLCIDKVQDGEVVSDGPAFSSLKTFNFTAMTAASEEDRVKGLKILKRMPNLTHLTTSFDASNESFCGAATLNIIADLCPRLSSIQ